MTACATASNSSNESGSEWPDRIGRDHARNYFGPSMYFIKSDDGKSMLVNPVGNGDGTKYIPQTYILQEGTGGEFPIGTWVGEYNLILIFTDKTATLERPRERPVTGTYRIRGNTMAVNATLAH